MKYLFVFIVLFFISSCKNASPEKPQKGKWRATLTVKDGKQLPFIFDYHDDNTLTIYNAEEKIKVTDVLIKDDSIYIQAPVFEGVFEGVFTEKTITGNFTKPSLNRRVPFVMKREDGARFNTTSIPSTDITGNWETVFSPNSDADRYIAKGIFKQNGTKITGTFRTTTGDYRYLDGAIEGDSLKLSTFDGAHAFLFEAKVTDSVMNGIFYSGNHWKEPFTAKRNETYELPDASSLTFLKEGYDKFAFSFPDTNGDMVSLEDPEFQDKVVIVQIMGTWCPNCLDETKYYTKYYNENKNDALAFVSLAFEYAPTKEKAFASIKRLQKKVGVPYPILLAQYGTSNKQKAQEKLPMLNHVLSYPTTVFIDKKGTVRKIHTGFNGPATGDKYTTFVNDFKGFVEKLVSE